MRIEYEISYEDMKSAYQAYRHRTQAREILDFICFRLLPITAAVSLIIFAVIVRGSNHQMGSSIFPWLIQAIALQAAIIIAAFSERHLGLNFGIRNMFPAMATDRNVVVEFGNDGVMASIPGFTRAEYAWMAISLVLRSARATLLYISPERFILIPNRVLTTEQKDSLNEIIALKGIKSRSC